MIVDNEGRLRDRNIRYDIRYHANDCSNAPGTGILLLSLQHVCLPWQPHDGARVSLRAGVDGRDTSCHGTRNRNASARIRYRVLLPEWRLTNIVRY
jgi:hypothetical protein